MRLRVFADVPNDKPKHIKLPALGMAAEFWTERAGGGDAEFTNSFAYLSIGTDRLLSVILSKAFLLARDEASRTRPSCGNSARVGRT